MCVCAVWETDREREYLCVCVCICVCKYVCVREYNVSVTSGQREGVSNVCLCMSECV